MENLAVWFEIPVIDMERARNFYSYVFHLDIHVEDMGGMPYGLFPMRGYGNSGALGKTHGFSALGACGHHLPERRSEPI